jgi:hypothetical protein
LPHSIEKRDLYIYGKTKRGDGQSLIELKRRLHEIKKRAANLQKAGEAVLHVNEPKKKGARSAAKAPFCLQKFLPSPFRERKIRKNLKSKRPLLKLLVLFS